MSGDDVQIILYRLEELEKKIDLIHAEVRKTNGRVTALEVENARYEGGAESRRTQSMVVTSVLSGCILAGVIWFVTQAI